MPDPRNIWSSLVDMIKGILSTHSGAPDYRSIPESPVPKTRSRARYSIVIMTESGAARQIKLTPNRIRLAIGAAIAAVVIVVVGFVGLFSSGPSDERLLKERDKLAKRIQTLEEENRKLELARSVEAHQIPQTASTAVAGLHRSSTSSTAPDSSESVSPGVPSGEPEESKLSPNKLESEASSRPTHEVPENPTEESEVTQSASSPAEVPPSRTASLQERSRVPSDSPSASVQRQIINFNARNVTALRDNEKKGMITFKLIKDQTDVQFSGYLFVIVETVNSRGEYKTLCYPKRAQLGPEDMPENFQDGAQLKFDSDKRVEVPYQGMQLARSLSRLSILIYGVDGNVVFQRGFERDEIKFARTGTARTKSLPRAQRARHAL